MPVSGVCPHARSCPDHGRTAWRVAGGTHGKSEETKRPRARPKAEKKYCNTMLRPDYKASKNGKAAERRPEHGEARGTCGTW